MLETLDDKEYLEPPNYEKNFVYTCNYCRGGIYAEEVYYEIEDKIYCKECMENDFKRYAENSDFWEE